ncbi:MAG: transcriptional repressor [Ktedonobacterales bacterium]|nr:transcriptional repressor [Ktedonobacterales bacterium]
MTTTPNTPAHAAHSERLRRLRLRVTPQRLFVLEALDALGGHVTAEAIMRWTARHYPAINLATIYRTLDLLVSVGLVAQTDLGGGAATFELVGDVPHHHLVCERCGTVTELDDALLAALREQVLRSYGFRAHSRHIALFGICRGCLAAEAPALLDRDTHHEHTR